MAQLRYLDMERGLEHEVPSQMRVWDQDADEYRTGHLQMVDCEVYIGRLAKSVVKDCFGYVQSAESYVESVLWKRVPNLLIYWLHQTIRRCLRELFQRDINVAGMKAEESSDWFLQSLCKESRQIGVEEINRITGSRNRRSWNKHARQACITLFASDPHIVSELGRLSDKEFDVVFRSGYKHLDILVQSAIAVILYVRGETTFMTRLACVPVSLEAFVRDVFPAAEDVLAGYRPRFQTCSPTQQLILFQTARLMCVCRTFIRWKMCKGRVLEICSRLAEKLAYATGGGSSLEANRREALFACLTGIMPVLKTPQPAEVATDADVNMTAVAPVQVSSLCSTPKATPKSMAQNAPLCTDALVPCDDTLMTDVESSNSYLSHHTEYDMDVSATTHLELSPSQNANLPAYESDAKDFQQASDFEVSGFFGGQPSLLPNTRAPPPAEMLFPPIFEDTDPENSQFDSAVGVDVFADSAEFEMYDGEHPSGYEDKAFEGILRGVSPILFFSGDKRSLPTERSVGDIDDDLMFNMLPSSKRQCHTSTSNLDLASQSGFGGLRHFDKLPPQFSLDYDHDIITAVAVAAMEDIDYHLFLPDRGCVSDDRSGDWGDASVTATHSQSRLAYKSLHRMPIENNPPRFSPQNPGFVSAAATTVIVPAAQRFCSVTLLPEYPTRAWVREELENDPNNN
jgi:hypothetical protein